MTERKDTLPPNLAMTNEGIFMTHMNRSNPNASYQYYEDGELHNAGYYTGSGAQPKNDKLESLNERNNKQYSVNKRRNMEKNIEGKYREAVTYIATECTYAEKGRSCNHTVEQAYVKNSPLNDWRKESKRFAITQSLFMIAVHCAMAMGMCYMANTHSNEPAGILLAVDAFFWFFYSLWFFAAASHRLDNCDFKKIREEFYREEMENMRERVLTNKYRELRRKFTTWPLCVFFLCTFALFLLGAAL